MHTTTTLRILAAALLTGGTFAVAAVGTPAVAVNDQGGAAQGTVVSRTDLTAPDSQSRNECKVRGDRFDGGGFWYWLVGPGGTVVAVFVDTGGSHIPDCHWNDGSWNNNWNNWDPSWSWNVNG
ncbi:hypothetical protein SAMN04487981_108173 [Streptomyces sp. cf386]|uniref:hypothetical protein n=1 Tax=Streptomyces sp. cf386 TaxID=1761904 RepID=UPI00088D154D|nr:hypothetical protein [Streptomyces sp. cf386]SDO08309.1 hypothetical protein SAMN04487981_108173 [Streptomyces sp. cf386]